MFSTMSERRPTKILCQINSTEFVYRIIWNSTESVYRIIWNSTESVYRIIWNFIDVSIEWFENPHMFIFVRFVPQSR